MVRRRRRGGSVNGTLLRFAITRWSRSALPALVHHETLSGRPVLDDARSRRGSDGAAEKATGSQRQPVEHARSPPVRSFTRSQCAQEAGIRASVTAERQQQELERGSAASHAQFACARNDANGFMRDDCDQVAHLAAQRAREQIEKGLPFELAPEQRADPSAGNAEGMPKSRFEGGNEGVRQHAAEGAGVDISTLRHRPFAAPLVPIVEQLADRWMLHRRLSLSRSSPQAVVGAPIRDGAADIRRYRNAMSTPRAGGEGSARLGFRERDVNVNDRTALARLRLRIGREGEPDGNAWAQRAHKRLILGRGLGIARFCPPYSASI